MRGFSVIGLYHPKDIHNVGGVMRAAYCFGAASVMIQGRRYKKVGTDTYKAWRHIPVFHVEDLFKSYPFDCIPVAVEIVAGAPSLAKFEHPDRAIYIFGAEDDGLPTWFLNKCAQVIRIPSMHSLNLAASVNIVLYDREAKR